MNSDQLTFREKMALRIFAVMYRIVGLNAFPHKDDKDVQFIMTGDEE